MSDNKLSVIVSIDVETTGESPSTASCIMIGCAVLLNIDPSLEIEKFLIQKKQWCINEIDGNKISEKCWNEFWTQNQSLWNYIKSNSVSPEVAMNDFHQFYEEITEKYHCIFVAAPSSFDWQWINCLYNKYVSEKKFSLPYSIRCYSTIKKLCLELGMSEQFINDITCHPSLQHTHLADDDALEQGYAYLKLTHWLKQNIKF